MEKLYWLEQIQASDRILVGEKAFQLSKVLQRGYPVLPGFVVSDQALWEFLHTLNQSEPLIADLPQSSLHLNVDNPRQLQQVAQRLQQAIITASLPSEWVEKIVAAVAHWNTPALIFRPSLAFNSTKGRKMKIFGLLEAQICTYQQDAIASALKQTWSQLFRARSLLYWQQNKIELQQINLAVLIQPLSNAIASGSLNYHSSELEIKASWGLGMAITRGEVQPDTYFVQSDTGAVRRTKSEPQVSQQLGNKTLAYGLLNSSVPCGFTQCSTPLLDQSYTSYLQTYVVSEAQQQQYALEDKYLQQLIHLAQQLKLELGSAFTLEWTLSESENSNTAQLYLTQVNVHHSPLTTRPYESRAFDSYTPLVTQPSIRGLGAAVGQVVATAYVIDNSSQIPETIPAGVILVASAIAPDWLPQLHEVVGIVTEHGGLTSHCAILARELGIPAVVSAALATQQIQTGETLFLNGDRGEIYRTSQERKLRIKVQEYNQSHSVLLNGNRKNEDGSHLTTAQFLSHTNECDGKYTPDTSSEFYRYAPPYVPIATQLLVNLSQPSLIERAKSLPADGVGLLRSEMMALNLLQGQHPNTWIAQGKQTELIELWQQQIIQFTRAFAPLPVFYRSLDWRSHEFQSHTRSLLFGEDFTANTATNPMLGQRGTFSYVQDPTMFDLELAALAAVQRSGYTNLHLLLPFVRTVEEFSFCRRRVEQAGLTQISQFQLWIMAEVPSVLFLLPQYVNAGVQGVSIGTNDLTQLLLGVDRDQGQLAAAFDERHPVVMQAIAQIIQQARQANIPCSICGQAPVLYPELIDSLVEWGITSISVEPDAVERTYRAIARAEQRLLLNAACNQFNSI